eukprot:1963132-Rhodomonas_salina.4
MTRRSVVQALLTTLSAKSPGTSSHQPTRSALHSNVREPRKPLTCLARMPPQRELHLALAAVLWPQLTCMRALSTGQERGDQQEHRREDARRPAWNSYWEHAGARTCHIPP